MIMNNALPVIKEKSPDDNKWIYLQHENASTHFGSDYTSFVTAARAEGYDIRLKSNQQTVPDLNISNDLSFFKSLVRSMGLCGGINQSMMFDSLIEAVQTVFFWSKTKNCFFLNIKKDLVKFCHQFYSI